MNKVRGKVNRLLDINFSDDDLSKLSIGEIRRIKLVNTISLISIITMLFYAALYAVVDFQLFKPAVIVLSSGTVVVVGAIVLNKARKYLLAKLAVSLATPLFMFIIAALVFGKDPEFHVYLLIAAMIPVFLWSYKQKTIPAILIVSILASYFYIEFFPPIMDPLIHLPENYIQFFNNTNVTACFIGAGFAIGIYHNMNRKMENQLVNQTNELKSTKVHQDTVYSIIAHDLRGPLGVFSNLTELVIDEYDDFSDEKSIEVLKSIHKSSVSLQNLLENLLDWSKMRSGNLEKSQKHFNLLDIVNESLSLHKELIEKKQQKAEIDVDSKMMIYADHHMTSTIFRNLISNAIKFTSQNGLISISASEKNENIEVCIQDSGIGIPEENLAKLFDIGSIDKIRHTSKEKGSGLGLLLCKDFVETQEGKIWVESEEGKGSSFYFTLPKSGDTGYLSQN